MYQRRVLEEWLPSLQLQIIYKTSGPRDCVSNIKGGRSISLTIPFINQQFRENIFEKIWFYQDVFSLSFFNY